MNVYIIVALVLFIYLVLAWFTGTLLQLHGASLWILRGGLALIGFIGAGVFLWFHRKVKRGTVAADQSSAVPDQITVLLRQAQQKLTASKQGSIGSLPVIFIVGELNSAKTSTLLHSGLEPELLAGHVFHDSNIVPTASINVWFARKTIFIEAGGKLSTDSQAWMHLLRQTLPPRLSAAVRKGEQAPRAALVCFDCERLVSSQNSAQKLSNRLKEMEQSLGAPFPVYVLFTKLDRIAHFADYVGNFTPQESAQVLGATLLRADTEGVFAEEQSKRLVAAFDQIVYSLAEKRLDYLPRESAAEKLPGIYEFPREFRKVRDQIVQFLVELTRPTQLSRNPFLRGFYFSGVRPVIINEAVSVSGTPKTAAVGESRATRMFNFAEAASAAAQPAAVRSIQSRKVPEWAFLPHLFTDIVLRDRAALSSSNRSTKIDRLRRVLLACAVLMCIFCVVAFLISFFNNRALENDFQRSAMHLAAIAPAAVETPNTEQLRELEQMRSSLETLVQYKTEGPPLSYRFGLYAGNRIYPAARSIYFQNFRRLLLAATQAKMVSILDQPPSTSTTDDFQQMYLTLKAYLITTRNHEHANWDALVAALLDRSPASKGADTEKFELIRRQFAFYATELVVADPLESQADAGAVKKAQDYLKDFRIEAIYRAMLDDAARTSKPVNFNLQFPGARGIVEESYIVPAAFTKTGFDIMQKFLQSPERFRAEEWVLGGAAALNMPVDSLRDTLKKRYATDYMEHWRKYLQNARVAGYGSLKDASVKLFRLTANDSPLLQLLWLAKENIAVEIPDTKNSFDALLSTARDSSPERLVGTGSQEYMSSLLQLQSSVQNIVNTPNGATDANMLTQAQTAVSAAERTVLGMSQHFNIDPQGVVHKNVQRLLQEPISYTGDAVRRSGGAPAESICGTVNAVTSKRPFNPRSSQQATLQDVQDMFRPQQGNLWMMVQGKLSGVVARQGAGWANVGAAPQSPGFLGFLNKAQQFTDTLFLGGSSNIHVSYTLRQLPASGVERVNLVIDGQSLADSSRSQQFLWQGAESSVSLTATAAGQTIPIKIQGPWALFEFFRDAEWTGNNPARLEWPLTSQVQFGHHNVSEASKTAVQYELTTQGSQIFSPGFLSGLHCSVR